jgi:hypothetical protein
LTLATLTQWAYIAVGAKDRPLYGLTDAYVFVVLLVSIGIYLAPSDCLAWFSTYFSASTIIVLLNIVLLTRIFGKLASPERSLLLFVCNVAQITLMFATWYYLHGVCDPLLKSILTLATISHVDEWKPVAMAQIATDFVLLAIFLSHLVGQLGPKKEWSPLPAGSN